MGLVNRRARTKLKEQVAPERRAVRKAEFDVTKKREVGVSDLTLLSSISDDAINDNLHKRFKQGSIYTYIGHVLISVNPFQDLGIYTPQTLAMYHNKNRLEVPPHVYAIAESMYYHLKAYDENQCVIISGESGAGKTEAAKQIMQYIANVSVAGGEGSGGGAGAGGVNGGGIAKIKDMVLATNPLLEAFGCAKTLRNNNSSRHGKYLEIFFNEAYQPNAAHITNYLLEKQRVVQQMENERNFHIFYQFTKACPPQYQLSFGIQGPETYEYTSAAKCVDADGIDDTHDFQETLAAMHTIGLTQLEQYNIFRMLAVVLWLGNVSFVEDDIGNAQVRDDSVTNFVAYLLQVRAELLVTALTQRVVTTSHGSRRGSTYNSPVNVVQAIATRDALAKGIYNNLFEWIVKRVNVSLSGSGRAAQQRSIGVLDIYGFEIFEHNSFEQICINYVNEKLQQIFIQLTLKAEQDEYVQEQITWTPIEYFNNKVVCDLIEATKPLPGLFAALNDSIKTAHADSAQADQVFAQRLVPLADGNRHFEDRRGKFIIKHYAGDVTYEVAGLTEKNKDNMFRDLLELLACSENTFVTDALFPRMLLDALTDSKKRPDTASDKIKRSANALVDTLSQCQPLYIRTIKPNQTKRPKEYDHHQVLHQIKYLGLEENVRIRRAGFAYRTLFHTFVQRFYLLSPKTGYAGDYVWPGDDLGAVREILRCCYILESEYQVGTTKVFIKKPETLFALEGMRDKYWHNMAARIQRAWRRYVQRRVDAAVVIQRAWSVKKHGNRHEQARDAATRMLLGRKQRRRFSMLGYRLYTGDYLGCNFPTGYGRFVVGQAQIAKPVVFSGEGEILLAKFGRSSRRLARTFVLTATALYVVAPELVDNRLQLHTEFTLPVAQILGLGMSTLQDDWLAVCVQQPTTTTPDIFINLPFKTELAYYIKQLRNVPLTIEPTVQYRKKLGKNHVVKFQVGAAPATGDVYKSGTVTVCTGLPATSANPKRPRNLAMTVDYSKYYNRGARTGYGAGMARAQPTYHPQTQAYQPVQPTYQPQVQLVQPVQPAQSYQAPVQQMQQLGIASEQKPVPQRPAKKAAPAPPVKKSAPPPSLAVAVHKPKHPTYKVLYDYDGSVSGTVALTKDDIVYVVSENGGWGLVKDLRETSEGWAPLNYMEKYEAPVATKAPLPPPSAQPVAQSATQPDGSAASLSEGLANALNAKKNEEATLAGSLADALKRRQVPAQDSDDDW
ncbi:Myo5 class I myosin [Metschnikowia bicuspidata]|uniref:Myo5 class I myosin n=2 Tax=Metschnikowia bicuspidata TaxID=27322 RepID=A0A4P9Z802_9ASCO|nr:Myo5 class I myosin [Metschnikowia bicuspidata]